VNIKLNEIANKTVIVSGGKGSMGVMVSDFINHLDGFEVIGIIDPGEGDSKFKNLSISDNLMSDYIFEFAPASVVNENIKILAKNESKLIIGSSGVNDESIELLKNSSKGIALIPNFSAGSAFQKVFSQRLSNTFKNVHIVEKHHSNKEDAPSGTSKDLASSLENINSEDIEGEYFATTKENSINIYSLRSDNYLAEQEVVFSNTFEEFIVDHKVNDRKAYLTGIEIVLRQMENINYYIYGLETLMKKIMD
jgi:4-hydroxy-tetrahydrodipicolinate reductase